MLIWEDAVATPLDLSWSIEYLFDNFVFIFHSIWYICAPLTKTLLTLENGTLNAVLRRKLKRLFYLYNLQQNNIYFRKCETYSNIVLFAKMLCSSIFCGVTPPPNYRPYSSRKGVVKIVQIWHRNVEPGFVQSSNQIISRGRHDSYDLSAHKISNLFYCWWFKTRSFTLTIVRW